MKLADFKVRPLPGSRFFFRVRIYETRGEMIRVARLAGNLEGRTAQACFCGLQYPVRPEADQGDVYLYENPGLRRDAVHELTHAAVHYVRYIGRGDLSIPNRGRHASAAEERLCSCMEHLLTEFAEKLQPCIRYS